MHLLIIEDNRRISGSLTKGLTEYGYTTNTADTGEAALLILTKQTVDLIILDLGLPDIDGMDLLPKLKELNPQVSVIILTARSEIEDRVAGLDAGADDYLTKPFAFSELVARIRAVERRGARTATAQIQIDDLTLDPIHRTAERNGQAIDLTPKAFNKVGNLAGGILFGFGWALTGACPGPFYALLGAGYWSIIVPLVGALLGVICYGMLKPKLPH